MYFHPFIFFMVVIFPILYEFSLLHICSSFVNIVLHDKFVLVMI
jgi:hypothetical protein